MYLRISVCLFVCPCTKCMPNAQGDQKRAPDLLELEFWMLVRHHIGAGKPGPSARAVSALNHSTVSLLFLWLYTYHL